MNVRIAVTPTVLRRWADQMEELGRTHVLFDVMEVEDRLESNTYTYTATIRNGDIRFDGEPIPRR